MNASNRGFRDRGTHNARNSLMSDNTGNRKSFDEVRVPPDNIGNKLESDLFFDEYSDGLGNSLDDEPAHLKSGILGQFSTTRNHSRRRSDTTERLLNQNTTKAGDRYMAQLNQEFVKLLGQKMGLAFAFSKKAMDSPSPASLETTKQELLETQSLIEYILSENGIKAEVAFNSYRTSAHWFSVFFIGPENEDPARSKDLIAALRQVVSNYTQKMVKSSINIFVVLANAKSVIEEHLLKVGAKKVEG